MDAEKKEKIKKQNKEASRRYRKKITSSNRREEFLQHDAERKRVERAREKVLLKRNAVLSNKKRISERDRKRRYRETLKKVGEEKLKLLASQLCRYKCPQTLGKAVKKGKNALPTCPHKKKVVLEHLSAIYNLSSDNDNHTRKEKQKRGTSEETIERIREFFSRDDISRQAPGKRDTKSVKMKDGKRETRQKRHLIMTVKEAFSVYKEKFPQSDVHISTFYSFRPKHILLSSEIPHNVCVCKYHGNFNFLVEAVHENLPTFPKTGRELLEHICCSLDNDSCMNNNCSKCDYDLNFSIIPLKFVQICESKIIKWQQWAELNNRLQIVETRASLTAAINLIENQIRTFKTHCYVKRAQESYFELRKQNLQNNEALIQIDFAENYSIISQDEIQAAHWSHSQITIFMCRMVTRSNHFICNYF